METAKLKRRVLVTGAAGNIGRAVVPMLRQRGHFVRGFDRQPCPDDGECIMGDLTDADAVRRAVEGCDAVVHLAANPRPIATFEDLLGPNVIGLHHVVDASRQAGVKRLVLASSGQVIFGVDQRPVPTTARAPENLYGMTKLWAEDLGEMVARCYDMQVVAARLGWVPAHAKSAAALDKADDGRLVYTSHRDTGRFMIRAVEAPLDDGAFVVAYAVGPGWDGQQKFDLEPGRKLLGYEPKDYFPDGMAFDYP